MTRRVLIDDIADPILRRVLIAALELYVDSHLLPQSEEARRLGRELTIRAVRDLYECGYLKIQAEGDRVRVMPCLPDDAPQLRSKFGNTLTGEHQ